MTALLLLLPWIFLGLSFLLGASLVRQHGRMLIRLDALERELVISRIQPTLSEGQEDTATDDESSDPSLSRSRINRNGLKPGTMAPPFSLSRVDGSRTVSLSEYLGRPFLLVFASPDCSPCETLLSRLADVPREVARECVLVVTRGGLEANREKFSRGNPAFTVVVQNSWEVSRLYGTFKMPSGYVIGADGTLACEVAVGPQPIWNMAQVLFRLMPSCPTDVRQAV